MAQYQLPGGPYFVGTAARQTMLPGFGYVLDTTSPGGGGAVTVTGQSVTQATQSTAGAITQTHLLAGAPCIQANQSGSAAVTQTHVLTGQSVTQANICTAGAVGAVTPHALAGAACSQANGSTTGAVTQTHVLAGAACQQVNTGAAGAVTQVHLLAGAPSQQVNTSTAGAVSAVPVITLTGAAYSQANTSTAGAITQTHVLMAAPVAVDNIASASAIVQTHMLAGANCSQGNTSTGGAVSDSSGPGIDWAVTGARAIVPPASTRAIVPHFDAVAIVPAANTRAIVPASGDDMDPIKTVEQYRQDREVYEIDFGAKYLTQANDTAATLKAVGSDAGITVTPQVAVGGALSSGVVKLAVDDPTAAGEYKVWAQIATTAGRERTGVIVVRVDDL